jgi:hypothetical protein
MRGRAHAQGQCTKIAGEGSLTVLALERALFERVVQRDPRFRTDAALPNMRHIHILSTRSGSWTLPKSNTQPGVR